MHVDASVKNSATLSTTAIVTTISLSIFLACLLCIKFIINLLVFEVFVLCCFGECEII